MSNFGFTEPDVVNVNVDELPRLIRTMRNIKDLTQEELAALSEVGRGTIASIEGSRQEVPLSVLSKLVDAMGYQVEIKLTKKDPS